MAGVFTSTTARGEHRVRAKTAEQAAKKALRMDKAADVVQVRDESTGEVFMFNTQGWISGGHNGKGCKMVQSQHARRGDVRVYDPYD